MAKIGVCIVAYNAEKYIARTIESVLVQKCDAEVVVYIGQDSSTDGTEAICRKYEADHQGAIVVLTTPANVGLVRNTRAVLERIVADGCDYVAMLDGDDYWCDEHKLQKQYSFLEAHEDYGFVHTGQRLLINDTVFKEQARTNVHIGDVWTYAGDEAIANCTVFFRTSLLKYSDFDAYERFGFMSLDYTMYIVFMKHTKFMFIPDVTAVWRRGHSSVSGGGELTKQVSYLENGIRQWKYLSTIFPDRWPYSEINGEKFRCDHKFLLAYRYGNFQMAYENIDNELHGWKYAIMRICAHNRHSFNVLYNLKFKKPDLY